MASAPVFARLGGRLKLAGRLYLSSRSLPTALGTLGDATEAGRISTIRLWRDLAD
jgi:hypothetical protein